MNVTIHIRYKEKKGVNVTDFKRHRDKNIFPLPRGGSARRQTKFFVQTNEAEPKKIKNFID